MPILQKLLAYLTEKEGCTVEKLLTDDQEPVIIRDVFGFRYEVKVKLLGRTQEDRGLAQNTGKLDFSKINGFSEFFYE